MSSDRVRVYFLLLLYDALIHFFVRMSDTRDIVDTIDVGSIRFIVHIATDATQQMQTCDSRQSTRSEREGVLCRRVSLRRCVLPCLTDLLLSHMRSIDSSPHSHAEPRSLPMLHTHTSEGEMYASVCVLSCSRLVPSVRVCVSVICCRYVCCVCLPWCMNGDRKEWHS